MFSLKEVDPKLGDSVGGRIDVLSNNEPKLVRSAELRHHHRG